MDASLSRVCRTPSVNEETAVARMEVTKTRRREIMKDSKFGSRTGKNLPALRSPVGAGWPFRLKSVELESVVERERTYSNNRKSACQASKPPSAEKNRDARSEETRTWTERTRRKEIDQQEPHP